MSAINRPFPNYTYISKSDYSGKKSNLEILATKLVFCKQRRNARNCVLFSFLFKTIGQFDNAPNVSHSMTSETAKAIIKL